MQTPGYPKGRPGEERAQLGALRGNSSPGPVSGHNPAGPAAGLRKDLSLRREVRGVGGFCERGKLPVALLITARNSCLKTKRGPPPGLRPFPHPTLPPPPPAGWRGCAAAQKRAGCAFVSAKQRCT